MRQNNAPGCCDLSQRTTPETCQPDRSLQHGRMAVASGAEPYFTIEEPTLVAAATLANG